MSAEATSSAVTPRPWWEIEAENWERIAARLEEPPKRDRASVLPQPKGMESARVVAATTRQLAAGLRAAGRRAEGIRS